MNKNILYSYYSNFPIFFSTIFLFFLNSTFGFSQSVFQVDANYKPCNGGNTGFIDIKNKTNGFTISPNPNSGKFLIKINKVHTNVSANFKLEIADLLGKCIYKNDFIWSSNPEIRMDVSFARKGIYILKIIYENAHFEAQKIIIE